MGRILSIDYGLKRIGMAWTDVLQISINPLPTIEYERFDLIVAELLKSNEVSDIVFGLSYHADGQITHVGTEVTNIITRYKKLYPGISFHTINEAFTSKRAREMMLHLGAKKKNRERKTNIDKMSAVLILKDFIDSL